MPQSHYPSGFGDGLTVQGLPILNTYSGKVFWVRSTAGSNSGPGTFDKPWATIDYAIGRCVADRGDVIMVKAGHAETISTSIALDVAGVSIVGMGGPTQKPRLTTSAATDCITVTADDCSIANLRFTAPGIDAVTADINVAAAGLSILGTTHIGSVAANNKVDIITLAAGGNDCLIDGVRIYNTVVECVGGIVIEAAVSRAVIQNCVVLDTIGFTDGCLSDEAAGVNFIIRNNVWQNAKAATAVVNFVTNTQGICSFNHISGRHTTIASNVVTGTAMDFFENRVTEQASVGGLISVPTVDVD